MGEGLNMEAFLAVILTVIALYAGGAEFRKIKPRIESYKEFRIKDSVYVCQKTKELTVEE
jgi:hypothetical protein